MEKMTRTILITDLDNTLYNFVDYFGPSFRSMLHALSRMTDISEDVLLDDFQSIFRERGSIEFSFTVQELSCLRALSPEQLGKLIHVARVAFSRTRRKNLQPYPGVIDGLEWAVHHKIPVVGFSNAPLYHAYRRLRELGISRYFVGLAAREDSSLQEGHEDIKGYKVNIENIIRVPVEQLKPNPAGYQLIMKNLSCDPRDVYVIGDSVDKDLIPAIELGATGIWASYGTKYEQKNMDTLIRVTDWSLSEIKTAYGDPAGEHDYLKIDSFSEISQYLPVNQASLFS